MNSILRKILYKIIPNSQTRIKIKNLLFPRNIKFYIYNKPKWGVSYSVWDGEELLEASINSIRKNVDYINVVWQKQSWFKEPCSENLEPLLLSLKERGLIDELILFEPDFSIKANQNEINKRNAGLKHARKAGCTHFMPMDADEFYISEEFENAKEYIMNFNLTHTACNQLVYTTLDIRNTFPSDCFITFFHKITGREKFVNNCCYPSPWLVDPTRQIPIKFNSKVAFLHMVKMHHLSGVRKDIVKKYRNSSALLSSEKQKEFLHCHDNEVIEGNLKNGLMVKVPNVFGIKID